VSVSKTGRGKAAVKKKRQESVSGLLSETNTLPERNKVLDMNDVERSPPRSPLLIARSGAETGIKRLCMPTTVGGPVASQ